MKAIVSIVLFFAVLFCSACTNFKSAIQVLPPGQYKVVNATLTGKFSATSFTGQHVVIDAKGNIVGGKLHFRHSNVYIPLIEFEVEAEDAFPPVLEDPK